MDLGPHSSSYLEVACTNASLAFSFYGFPNCIAFADSQRNNIQNVNPSQPFSSSANSTLPNSNAFNDFVVLVDGCMNQYCEDPSPDVGGCPYKGIRDFRMLDATELGTLHGTQEYGSKWLRWYSENLCSDTIATVNADIGGIGVFISYIAQSALAVIIWLLVRVVALSKIFKQQLLKSREAGIPNNSDISVESQKAPAPPVGSGSWFSNQMAVLKSSTIDFQEAQCFLMLACQAAAFATLRTQGEFLEAKSIQMLYNNFALLSLIAVGGILPVTFVLFVQHTVRMRSLFNLTLSGITIFISVAALFNVPEQTTQDFLEPLTDTSRLDKCGYNVPPVAYCVFPGGFDVVSELNRTLLLRQATSYCIFVYCGVLVLHISALGLPHLLPRMTSKAETSHGRASRAMETIYRYMSTPWFRLAKFATILALDIVFLVFLFQYLQRFIKLLEVGAIETQAWGFGQIIAVTVWFQVLIKYGHWSIFGMEGQSSLRIARPFRIVRDWQMSDAAAAEKLGK